MTIYGSEDHYLKLPDGSIFDSDFTLITADGIEVRQPVDLNREVYGIPDDEDISDHFSLTIRGNVQGTYLM